MKNEFIYAEPDPGFPRITVNGIEKEHPVVTITYFVPDGHKAGGEYVTVTGMVRKYRADERVLEMNDGAVIQIDEISDVL